MSLTKARPALASERRRLEAKRLVHELAARMWAPGGIPARPTIAVRIPPRMDRASKAIDPRRWYRIPLDDGQVELGGAELVTICRTLAALADAQRAGDLDGVERALSRLAVPSWH